MPNPSKTFKCKVLGDDKTSGTGLEVNFDPEPVFGKKRVPVVVDVIAKKGDRPYSFRSTIAHMGANDPRMDGVSCTWVPLRREHREAIGEHGVKAGDTVTVTLTLDTEERTVEVPKDLKAALKAEGMLETFEAMSFTHKREYVEAVEDAKKPETRERRIDKCVEMMHERAAEREAKAKAREAKKAAKPNRDRQGAERSARSSTKARAK
ncbi:MAG: YdeI/OmpD-associated family protein [Phycisphaerales bacterium]